MNVKIELYLDDCSGLLMAESKEDGKYIGTQFDNLAQNIIFTRPRGYETDDLIVQFSMNQWKIERNLHAENSLVLDYQFTQKLQMTVAVILQRVDSRLEASNLITFKFRPGVKPIGANKTLVTTATNEIPYIFESQDGRFYYHSNLDNVDKRLGGDTSGSGGGIPDAPNDGNTYGRKNYGWTAIQSALPINIINDLTTGGVNAALSAQMGVLLSELNDSQAVDIANLSSDVSNLSTRMDAQEGLGGYVKENDFGTATPAQEDITAYVKEEIWPGAGSSHANTEIFNGTRVVNSFDNMTWILANTPDTIPPVFSWEEGGSFSLAVATETALGGVRSNPGVTWGVSFDSTGKGTVEPGSTGGALITVATTTTLGGLKSTDPSENVPGSIKVDSTTAKASVNGFQPIASSLVDGEVQIRPDGSMFVNGFNSGGGAVSSPWETVGPTDVGYGPVTLYCNIVNGTVNVVGKIVIQASSIGYGNSTMADILPSKYSINDSNGAFGNKIFVSPLMCTAQTAQVSGNVYLANRTLVFKSAEGVTMTAGEHLFSFSYGLYSG